MLGSPVTCLSSFEWPRGAEAPVLLLRENSQNICSETEAELRSWVAFFFQNDWNFSFFKWPGGSLQAHYVENYT